MSPIPFVEFNQVVFRGASAYLSDGSILLSDGSPVGPSGYTVYDLVDSDGSQLTETSFDHDSVTITSTQRSGLSRIGQTIDWANSKTPLAGFKIPKNTF